MLVVVLPVSVSECVCWGKPFSESCSLMLNTLSRSIPQTRAFGNISSRMKTRDVSGKSLHMLKCLYTALAVFVGATFKSHNVQINIVKYVGNQLTYICI